MTGMRQKRKETRNDRRDFFKSIFDRAWMLSAGDNFVVTGEEKDDGAILPCMVSVSVLMVILGIVIKPSQIERYMRGEILALVLIVVLSVVWGLWFISTQVSILMRKNQELAMQTSLLNQDSENMLRQIDLLKAEIEVLKKRNETEENSR